MKPYNKFAAFYDKIGHDRHSINMVEYTNEIMNKFNIEATDVLDICCGTGAALKIFEGHGMNVTGLDQSRKMLSVAREKLRGKNVRLINQSLPSFKITSRSSSRQLASFDLITCYFDSLNYLSSERKLQGSFKSVSHHLREGGYFIFDMNTALALKTLWGSDVFGDAQSDHAWIWRSKYYPSKKMARLKTTHFVKSGLSWKRFDELHIEYGYTNSSIRRMLREAGFQIDGFYKCFTFREADKETNRICVVARKRR